MQTTGPNLSKTLPYELLIGLNHGVRWRLSTTCHELHNALQPRQYVTDNEFHNFVVDGTTTIRNQRMVRERDKRLSESQAAAQRRQECVDKLKLCVKCYDLSSRGLNFYVTAYILEFVVEVLCRVPGASYPLSFFACNSICGQYLSAAVKPLASYPPVTQALMTCTGATTPHLLPASITACLCGVATISGLSYLTKEFHRDNTSWEPKNNAVMSAAFCLLTSSCVGSSQACDLMSLNQDPELTSSLLSGIFMKGATCATCCEMCKTCDSSTQTAALL